MIFLKVQKFQHVNEVEPFLCTHHIRDTEQEQKTKEYKRKEQNDIEYDYKENNSAKYKQEKHNNIEI